MLATTQRKRAARPKRLTQEEIGRMTIAEYMDYCCYDRRSTLAYFKRIGLTWDRKGNPVVVPR